MKITIEPSHPEPHYVAASIDTLTNDDSATNAVESALQLIVCIGHSKENVASAAQQWAEDSE